MRDLLSKLDAIVNETALKDKEDLAAKRKTLQDIQMDPNTSKDPELKAELAQRKAALEKEAKSKGFAEAIDFDQIRKDAADNVKKSIDKQSDDRIAKMKSGDDDEEPFMAQVGRKIIGGVKGAVKGAARGFSGKEGFEVGDEFGISFSEDFEIATDIVDLAEDGIVIDLDEHALELLSAQGWTFEDGELEEGVAGPQKCWKGYRKVGTKPGTGKNAGKRVNDCEKIGEGSYPFAGKKVGHKEGPAGQLKGTDPKGYPKGKLVGSSESFDQSTLEGFGSMEEQVQKLLKKFDSNMNEIGGYGDPDIKEIIQHLKNGDVESAVEVVWYAYTDQDGGEIDMDAYIEDLEADFEELVDGGDQDTTEGKMSEVDIDLQTLANRGDEEDLIAALEGEFGPDVADVLQNMMEDLKDELAAKGMNDVMNDQDKMIEMLWDKIVDEYSGNDSNEDYESIKMEAEYRGKKVPLGKKLPGDVKKSKVYVRKPNGKVVKVNFGDKKMRIKKSNPKRRKSFRARHNCKNPGPRWKARYWSCRSW